jgi:hypothetical protein
VTLSNQQPNLVWHLVFQYMYVSIIVAFFFYLFGSRDSAIYPEGICGLGKTKEMGPVSGPRPVYGNKGNPPPSAVRCAQVSGCEPPSQESIAKKNGKQDKENTATKGRRKTVTLGVEYRRVNFRPSELPFPPSPMPPSHPFSRHRLRPHPSHQPSLSQLLTALGT